MIELEGFQKKYLRGVGQKLKPVVRIGKAGLTEGVLAKLDHELDNHELIKLRVGLPRDERAELIREIARVSTSLVLATIGQTALLFRQHADPEKRSIRLLSRREHERRRRSS